MNISSSIRTLKKSHKLLHNNLKFSYFSPIDKPVLSLTLKSFHEFSAEAMIFSFTESVGVIAPEASVLLGAIAFRFALEGVSSIVKSFNYDNKNTSNFFSQKNYINKRAESNERAFVKLIDKVLILDSVRDLQFYGVSKDDINNAIWFYLRPSVLIASIMNTYLTINFLRGAYLISSTPQFASFCASSIYLPNLALHDPLFITPILIIFANFILMKGSRHPLLIHLNHPNNLFSCINFAFMGGLLFVPVPGIYHFAYLGLAIGHLTIRTLRHLWQDSSKRIRKIIL